MTNVHETIRYTPTTFQHFFIELKSESNNDQKEAGRVFHESEYTFYHSTDIKN
jgi:hypothetical protein